MFFLVSKNLQHSIKTNRIWFNFLLWFVKKSKLKIHRAKWAMHIYLSKFLMNYWLFFFSLRSFVYMLCVATQKNCKMIWKYMNFSPISINFYFLFLSFLWWCLCPHNHCVWMKIINNVYADTLSSEIRVREWKSILLYSSLLPYLLLLLGTYHISISIVPFKLTYIYIP